MGKKNLYFFNYLYKLVILLTKLCTIYIKNICIRNQNMGAGPEGGHSGGDCKCPWPRNSHACWKGEGHGSGGARVRRKGEGHACGGAHAGRKGEGHGSGWRRGYQHGWDGQERGDAESDVT
jgi:hypothetical protein